ncbi:hypothetical protein IF2G_01227 [Cordyceps javanica]|nr:hypothetical protein IF2G_01227 [Cordyceps javanica]
MVSVSGMYHVRRLNLSSQVAGNNNKTRKARVISIVQGRSPCVWQQWRDNAPIKLCRSDG